MELFNDEQNKVIYDKRLALMTGSVNAAILLQQIIYWSSKKEWNKFFKFTQPCTHELYKDGDSWCEELGLSPKEFETAIKCIGYKFGKSKNILTKESALVNYYTDNNRITWYSFNIDLFNKLIKAFYLVNQQSGITKKTNIQELLLYYNQLHTENTHIENHEKNYFHTDENTIEDNKKSSKKSKSSILYEKEFNEFWSIALRKEDKQRAYNNLKKLLKLWTRFEIIMEGFKKYNLSRKGKDPEYTKKPANRLSGINREDEVLPEKAPQTDQEKYKRRDENIHPLPSNSEIRKETCQKWKEVRWDDIFNDIMQTYNRINNQ